MSTIWRPNWKFYCCVICGARTAQRHHAAYHTDWRRPRDRQERWHLIPLCDRHHEGLHTEWDLVDREVQLPLFTLQHVLAAIAAERRAIEPVMLERTLSFGEQIGPEAEYWLTWAAEEKRARGFDEMTWTDRDDREDAA